MSSVTIRDVAAEAGVSLATASRALAGRRRVSADLVARVEDAAARLGYRRNAVAGALRSQRTGIIGVVVPEISNPFFPAMVQAIERRLQQTHRDLVLCDSQDDPNLEAHRVRALVERQVDGLIISPCDAVLSADVIKETRDIVPVVQLDRFVDGDLTDWVGVDDHAGIGALLTHLIEAGAQTFAYVGAQLSNSSARLRLSAYQTGVSLLQRGSEQRVLLGGFSSSWGYEAGHQLLALRGAPPDAIVCGNDEIAFGLSRALREASVRIPYDVMVTGFDDVAFAELLEPPLTTARQPREEMANEVLRLLDQRVHEPGRGNFQRVAVSPSLVIRGSTRAAATAT